jgi:hypothetical protein
MPTPIDPWRVFFHSLRNRNSRQIETWLDHWAFSDAGAALIHSAALHESTPLSNEEKQKRAVRVLMTMGKRPKILH